MPDVNFPVLGGLFKKMRDRGDGTHAEVVASDVVRAPGVALNVAIGSSASSSVPLSAACRVISMYATAAAFFSIGAGDQSVNSSSHYIAAGERLDFAVPLLAEIAVLRAAGVDGVLYITELQ